QKEEVRLGGAGGVAANLAALGATVRVVGVIGPDDMGRQLRKHLIECGADPGTLDESPGRPTTCKVRLVGLAQHRHPQLMMRIDVEEHAPMASDVAGRVLDNLANVLGQADVLCVEDYNKGLLTDDLCRRAVA